MAITPQQALQRLIEHREIFYDEMLYLMRQFMQGEVSPVMMAAIISALRVKKETIGEITASAAVMREFSVKVVVSNPQNLVDIVGTGGDGSHTFNISTCSMLVAAGAGARLSKHGGRSVSSKSGSADVLEALGVNINLTPAAIARCIEQIGLGFMFAPNHHSATKNVAPVRKEMGVKTIFNILGPLTNPSGAENTLIGVFHADLVGIMVRALMRLGVKRALVVYGRDGLDELTLGASTLVGELRDGQIHEYEVSPSDYGLAWCESRVFKVADAQESKEMVLAVLENRASEDAMNIVTLNAGAALFVANQCASIKDGMVLARRSIESGAAKQKLEALIKLSNELAVE